MNSRKYNSFKQIEEDLKILKLQKEIRYQQLVQNSKSTRDSLGFATILPDLAIGFTKTFSTGIKGALIAFLLKKLFRR